MRTSCHGKVVAVNDGIQVARFYLIILPTVLTYSHASKWNRQSLGLAHIS